MSVARLAGRRSLWGGSSSSMRALRIAALLALALVGLVAGAIAALTWAPGAVLRAGSWAMGIEAVAFDDVRLGLARAEIDGLALGAPPDWRLGRLRIDYRLSELLRGRADVIDAEGLELTGRITDRGVELAGFDGDAAPRLPLPRPERVVVRGASADLASPWGRVHVPFTAEATLGDTEVGFAIESDDARLEAETGQLRGNLILGGRAPLASTLRLQDIDAHGQLELVAEDLDLARTAFDVDGRAVLDLVARDGTIVGEASGLWAEVAWFAPTLAVPSPRPPLRIRLADRGPAPRMIARVDGDRLSLDLVGALALTPGSDAAAVVEADLEVLLDPHGDAILHRLSGNGVVSVANLALGSVTLRDGRIGIEGEGTPAQWRATLDLELAGDAEPRPRLTISGVTLEQRLDATWHRGRLTIMPEDVGTLSIEQVAWETGSIGKLGWRLLRGEAPLVMATDRRPAPWQHTLGLEGEPFDLSLDGGLPIRARVDPGTLSLDLSGAGGGMPVGRASLHGWRARLPSWQLDLEGIRTEIALGAAGPAEDHAIPLSIAAIRHLGEPPLFAPLELTGEVQPDLDVLTFEARLTRAAAGLELDVGGEHDMASGRGRATLDLAPLSFGSDGRRAEDLAPALQGRVAAVSGRIALQGTVGWNAGTEIAADLDLLVDDLAATAGPARFEQVNGLINLDRLLPPTTPSGQQLAIGQLDFGLPLTAGLVVFELRPGPEVAISSARWDLAGGTVGAAPFSVGSAGSDIVVTLTADRLDLGQLLALTRLPGLSGEGSMGGTLPVRISGAEVAIDGGELRADGPGWLRYRPGRAPGVLAEGGEGVDLLLEALENFRYEALRITLDGRTDAAMDIGLHLRGSNPELYGGHPIEFNLDLEGELANILRRGIASWQLPDRIREQMRGFRTR